MTPPLYSVIVFALIKKQGGVMLEIEVYGFRYKNLKTIKKSIKVNLGKCKLKCFKSEKPHVRAVTDLKNYTKVLSILLSLGVEVKMITNVA